MFILSKGGTILINTDNVTEICLDAENGCYIYADEYIIGEYKTKLEACKAFRKIVAEVEQHENIYEME